MFKLIEIVFIRLDVRAFRDREPHVGENLDQLVHHLGHGMNAPLGLRA